METLGYIKFDYSKAGHFIDRDELAVFQHTIHHFHEHMLKKSVLSSDSMGWLNIPETYDEEEYENIKRAADRVRADSDILIVIGVGGSYTGIKAGIEMLNHSFYNHLSAEQRNAPQIFFAGTNLSSTYITDLLEIIDNMDFSINVVSKSGTTLESALGFRIFKRLLITKYGEEEAAARIYVTTDQEKGHLKEESNRYGYETFTIPQDIGGRFSVLTPVGLFPMAVSGISIDQVMNGAAAAKEELEEEDISKNNAYQYAAVRNILYNKGKTIELLASFEPKLQTFSGWWKQLYAESEGKNKKGIFPVSALFTTDLHSIGQYIQEGRRELFETMIKVETAEKELVIEEDPMNMDQYYDISGKTFCFVNEKALEGTRLAHMEGGVPNLLIQVPEISPFSFGYLVYFFQLSCALSALLLGVNPFDQPGVEVYKKNMLALTKQHGAEFDD